MPRRARVCPAGVCFYVLNRAVARLPLCKKPKDYDAFERVVAEAYKRVRLPIFSYCVMPNHWHFVVRPKTKYQVTDFFRWLTNTHTMRWHAHHHTAGTGHLYQGRFKSFRIEEDDHLLTVFRYVERKALRANLCERAEDWNCRIPCGQVADRGRDIVVDAPRASGSSFLAFSCEASDDYLFAASCVLCGYPSVPTACDRIIVLSTLAQ